MKLSEETFVCIDCESTGLDTAEDRIVEVAVARFNFDQVLQTFETLVDPEREIPQTSQDIHNISQEMIVGKPKIREVLPKILEMIDSLIIVGHGINFDIALIANEAKRAQIPTNILSQPYIDTLRLARLYGESPVNSLERLRQHFNIDAGRRPPRDERCDREYRGLQIPLKGLSNHRTNSTNSSKTN